MVDKRYCMSSYLAFVIEDDSKEFYDGAHHKNIKPLPDKERILVKRRMMLTVKSEIK